MAETLEGSQAKVTPAPNGLMSMFYGDRLGRKVLVQSDGIC